MISHLSAALSPSGFRFKQGKDGNYDALILLGGVWKPIMLPPSANVLALISAAHERGTLIVAICQGPQLVISSNSFRKERT
jgi:putative intracellular protease/amidase